MTTGERRRRPKFRWLLRDDFTDARAALAINGTRATDGFNMRTVVDTESKLTIGAGGLVIAGGMAAPAQGDPGLWESVRTRVAGRILLAKFTITDVTNRIEIGWDSTQHQEMGANPIRIASDTLKPYDGGSAGPTLFVPVDATEYLLAVILRALGAQYYLRGGTLTKWRLVWASLVNNTGTLYPGISNYNAAGSMRLLRIPENFLYLASPLLSDSFNRANGALGSTDGAGHAETSGVGSGGSGGAWMFDAGVWTVATNAAVGTPTQGSDIVVNGAFVADTDWTKGTGWAIAADVASGTLATSDLTAIVAPLTLGAWYLTSFDLANFVAGTAQLVIGAATNPTHGANGTFAETMRATSTALAVRGVGFTGNIDNVIAKSLALSSLFSTINCGTPNVFADCEVKTLTTGTQCGMVLRLDSAASPANFVLVYFDGLGNIKVDECVAGVYAQLASVASAFTTGDVLRCTLDGSAYRVYKIATSGTGTATLISAGTTNVLTGNSHGAFSTYSGNAIERIVIYPTGAEGQHESLQLVAEAT